MTVWKHKIDRRGNTTSRIVAYFESEGGSGAFGTAGQGRFAGLDVGVYDADGNLHGPDLGDYVEAAAVPGQNARPDRMTIRVVQDGEDVLTGAFWPVETAPGLLDLNVALVAGLPQAATPEQLRALGGALAESTQQRAQVAQAVAEAGEAANLATQRAGVLGSAANEAALAGQPAGDYRVGQRLVSWSGTAVTARTDVLPSSDATTARWPTLTTLLADTSERPTHVTDDVRGTGSTFVLLPAGDSTPVDGGLVYQRADGRKVRRLTLPGRIYAAWFGIRPGEDRGDQSAAIVAVLKFAAEHGVIVVFEYGVYLIGSTMVKLAAWGALYLEGMPSVAGSFDALSFHPSIPHVEFRYFGQEGDGTAVLRCEGDGNAIQDVVFVAGPAQRILYYHAELPNLYGQHADYGLHLTGGGNTLRRVEGTQAKKIGIYSPNGAVQTYDRVMAAFNGQGIENASTDSMFFDVLTHHNVGDGLTLLGNYPRVVGGRTEWNGRRGARLGGNAAEWNISAYLADSNAWCGLYGDGVWGGYAQGRFTRNGRGGDGTVGRWGWAHPGNPAYIATPVEEDAQVRLRGVRYAELSLTVRAGQGDGDDGARGAAVAVYGDNVNDSHAMIRGTWGTSNPNHPVAMERLTNYSQASLLLTDDVPQIMARTATQDVGMTQQFDVALPADWAGQIHLFGGGYGKPLLAATIDVARRSDNAYAYAVVTNRGGTVAAASLIEGVDGVRVQLDREVFARYRCVQMI